MYYLGIDLGGTTIKGGVVDESCRIICKASCETGRERPAELVTDDIAALAQKLAEEAGIPAAKIGAIGIGCPGTVDNDSGVVRYSNNLNWVDFPLRRYLGGKLPGVSVVMGNDANVAAYGEYCAGSAKGAESAVIITLGTGVGSGVVINSKIVTGHNAAASEFGHMAIVHGGRFCTCGRQGCWEAYSSATALIAMTKEAMAEDKSSLMWKLSEEEGKVSGVTAFQAAQEHDPAGLRVVETYTDYLACGLANVVNALQPEIISLGGGISKQGEYLLAPLREKVKEQVFGRVLTTQINTCTLGNDAGIIGAAMLGA